MMLWLATLETFLRSFFLQTLWNFERMQNMGFAFAVTPLLKRAHPNKDAYQDSVRRHTAFFNTHPYFASIVLGVVYFREKDRPKGKLGGDAALTVLKDSMGGAFGAIGDHVIWGTWRPFCAIMALGLGMLVAYPTAGGQAPSIFDPRSSALCARWWVAGFLGVFSTVHLWLRWRGLQIGIKEGPQAVKWLQGLHLQSWAAQIRRIGLLLLVVMTMFYLARWNSSEMLLWMISILLGTVILKRWRAPSVLIFYLVCATCVAMTYLGIEWP